MTGHNQVIERQARWHATKVILTYLSTISILVVVGYINLFYLFVVIASVFALMIGGAIFQDAYYSKLLELNKGRWNEPKD
jgi:hypothetical protein